MKHREVVRKIEDILRANGPLPVNQEVCLALPFLQDILDAIQELREDSTSVHTARYVTSQERDEAREYATELETELSKMVDNLDKPSYIHCPTCGTITEVQPKKSPGPMEDFYKEAMRKYLNLPSF